MTAWRSIALFWPRQERRFNRVDRRCTLIGSHDDLIWIQLPLDGQEVGYCRWCRVPVRARPLAHPVWRHGWARPSDDFEGATE